MCISQESSSPTSSDNLIPYIAERTVHVQIHRKLFDGKKVYKNTHLYSWGTGTVMYYENLHSYILTANHVVQDDGMFTLHWDGKDFRVLRTEYFLVAERRNLHNQVIDKAVHGKVVKQNSILDLALIEFPYNFRLSEETKIAQNVQVGQQVHMMGYPSLRAIGSYYLSYSRGTIATVGINKEHSLNNMPNQIRFDINGYFGNSGGALINNRGEIVGVVSMMTGWSISRQSFIPHSGCIYGPSVEAIRHFLYVQK